VYQNDPETSHSGSGLAGGVTQGVTLITDLYSSVRSTYIGVCIHACSWQLSVVLLSVPVNVYSSLDSLLTMKPDYDDDYFDMDHCKY